MLMLPPIPLGRDRVRFPVSGESCLSLLAAASDTEDRRRDSVGALLPGEPGLILWAAGCEPRLTKLKWGDLVDRVTSSCGSVVENTSTMPTASQVALAGAKQLVKYRKALERFLSATSSELAKETAGMIRRLRKFLARVSKVDPHAAEEWLGDRLQADLFSELAAAESVRRASGETQPSPLQVLSSRLDRLAELESSFENRLLAEKLASLKQLAYGASHEINNPLANITTRAEALMAGEPDSERARKLAAISQQAFRAHEMIANMMLFAHPPTPDLQIVDPVLTLKTVVDQLTPSARAQNTELEAQLGSVPPLRVDQTQLSVAVTALIQNALESLQQDGRVLISLDQSDESVVIDVADDGPGIAPEQLKHIFDPFFSGREAGRGLGFGLSKAWRIAEMHSGELVAENRPHGGALFRMRLPYARAG